MSIQKSNSEDSIQNFKNKNRESVFFFYWASSNIDFWNEEKNFSLKRTKRISDHVSLWGEKREIQLL